MLEDRPAEWSRDGYRISTARSDVEPLLHAVLALLHETHWGGGLEAATLERAARNSICFAVMASDGRLVGFARAISDLATYAYLTDVVVAPEARGVGLGE